MTIQNKAVAEVEVAGTDKAARELGKVAESGKKAGKDLSDAFKDAGKALAAFGASAVDAVVDIKSLDPAALVKTFEDYTRAVTKTAIATGQTIDGLKQRYSELARANAVLPQTVDTFAKSVGRLTGDIRGAADAFSGLHNAALAFGETDQEQVGFAAYLKNVRGVAGDTTAAVGRLFAQAEKLGTVGGPRALRDLFLGISGDVDRLVSRFGQARGQTEALAGVLTKGATGPQAQRIASGVLGFLGGSPLDVQRTLGRPLFDKEGRYKDPLGTIQSLYDLARKPTSQGGRGLDDERILLAFQSNLGLESGSALFYALKEGRFGQARGLANIGPSGTPAAAGARYRESQIGQLDASRVNIFESELGLASPLFDLKAGLSGFVGEHPLASLGIAYGLKAALTKGLPKLATKFGAPLLKGGLGAAGSFLSVLPVEDIFLPDSLQTKAGSGSELGSTPLAEIIKERASPAVEGHVPPPEAYGGRAAEIRAAEEALRARGVDPSQLTTEQITEALKEALQSSTVKVEIQNSPARTAEAEKDPASKN